MRRLGYQAIDAIVARFEASSREERPYSPDSPYSPCEPDLSWLDEPLPEAPSSAEEVFRLATGRVMRQGIAYTHPRCFAQISSPSNFISVLADSLMSGFNLHAGSHTGAPAAAEVERVALEWLRELLGLPEGTSGLFTSGGSVASLIALVVARNRLLGAAAASGVLYCTAETHPVIARGAMIVGLPRSAVRHIRVRDRRMDVEALSAAIREDRDRGLRPFCVVANAGTTGTGAVDDLPAIAQQCRLERLWFHVDGAFGASAACTRRGRSLLRGLELADSIAVDPHKWLFQPYEMGCILLRRPAELPAVFCIEASYFPQTGEGARRVEFKDRGIELTRSFKALKLWMSMKVFGASAFRRAVNRGLDLADVAADEVRGHAGWRLITHDGLGIVTFRCEPEILAGLAGDALQRRLAAALAKSGVGLVGTAVVDGRVVLRMCIIHPHTTPEDVRETIRWLVARARVEISDLGTAE